jgi:hypothetical protein
VVSDLQGIARGELLGIAVAAELAPLTSEHTGVIIAGDMFSVAAADKRGGFGDVAPVWHAFADRFRWVAGVSGNHDDVRAVRRPNAHVLDGGESAAAESKPDILVLHEGPQGDEDQPGHAGIDCKVPLIVCGHVHWPRPLFAHSNGQVLNADARAIVLVRA